MKFMKILEKRKKTSGYLMLGTMYYQLHSVRLDKQWVWEELNGFRMKNSLTLPALANRYFISLRDENNESIYTYTDPLMRNFVRKCIKRGKCNASNQRYKSEFLDEVFNII